MTRSPRMAFSCSPSSQELDMLRLAILKVSTPPIRMTPTAPIKIHFFLVIITFLLTAARKAIHVSPAPQHPKNAHDILGFVRPVFHAEHPRNRLVGHVALMHIDTFCQTGVLLCGFAIAEVRK